MQQEEEPLFKAHSSFLQADPECQYGAYNMWFAICGLVERIPNGWSWCNADLVHPHTCVEVTCHNIANSFPYEENKIVMFMPLLVYFLSCH